MTLTVLLKGSRSVYIAGDTDIFDGMRSISRSAGRHGIDLGLLPVGGWGLHLGPGHLDPERAAVALCLLRPRLAIAVHWGQLRIPALWRTQCRRFPTPAAEFAARAAQKAPERRVVLALPGQPVDVPLLASR
jgi:L-ascorbate metabolism protein UlaG (beta-lactamase superfamily)